MSSSLLFDITLHGFLLWASMGFLMPVGILVIRMSNREQCGRRLKILFYIHTILQASSSQSSPAILSNTIMTTFFGFCFHKEESFLTKQAIKCIEFQESTIKALNFFFLLRKQTINFFLNFMNLMMVQEKPQGKAPDSEYLIQPPSLLTQKLIKQIIMNTCAERKDTHIIIF